MGKDNFSGLCQNCGGHLRISSLECPDCKMELRGEVVLPRLARLTPDDREFIELFVLSAGSLKEVGRALDLSYPTVRAKLDKVINALQELDREKSVRRMEIISKLEKGEITAEEASTLLGRIV